jgi:TPP-dependent 2-oxoacid decarboxylase
VPGDYNLVLLDKIPPNTIRHRVRRVIY